MPLATFRSAIVEPSSTITFQVPALGRLIATLVSLFCGTRSAKNFGSSTSVLLSGMVMRSPLGPTSVTLGAWSVPVMATAAPGRPLGSSKACSLAAWLECAPSFARYGPRLHPLKYGVGQLSPHL